MQSPGTMILLGIGANLPRAHAAPPLATCRAAVAALRVLPGYTVQSVSPWYETAPIPPSGQPPYVNGAARLDGPVEPDRLLTELQAIEAAFGRVRTVANAARPLDLDIIAIGDLIRTRPDPVLPHPRAHQRAFVLRPLADVAPGWNPSGARRNCRDAASARSGPANSATLQSLNGSNGTPGRARVAPLPHHYPASGLPDRRAAGRNARSCPG